MADYQGFASNVLRAITPPPDNFRQNALMAYQLQGAQEDRALRREENALNRGYRERQLTLAENADKRAASTDERQATVQQIELGAKINKRALELAGPANDPASWDAAVTQYAQELDQIKPGLGQTALQYRGRFAEKQRIMESLVSADSRYAAEQARLRQEAGFGQQSQLQAQSQAFTAGQNTLTREATATENDRRIAAQRELKELELNAEKGTKANKNADDLRKEFNSLKPVQNFREVETAYNGIVDAASRDTKASDLNMVYGLAKIFDPGSVVREGEQVLVTNTAGLPQQLVGLINSVNGGARLSGDTRKALIAEAKSRYEANKKGFDQFSDYYGSLAEARGVARNEVLMGPVPTAEATVSGGAATPPPAAPPPDIQSLIQKYGGAQ